MKIKFVSNGINAIPAFEEDKEKFNKSFPEGEAIEVTVKSVRNYKFLKKYWSLITLVFDNLPEHFCLTIGNEFFIQIPTKDELHYHIKIKAGLYERKLTWGGFETLEVKSIAFDKMDDHEFSKFYDNVFDIVCDHFLVDSKREEIEPMLAGYY